jgi:hypothetical protein
MFFVFVHFCCAFFRFKEYKIYAKEGDPIEIVFTGMKKSDCPIAFDLDFQNLLCDKKITAKSYSSFGESIVGLKNQVTEFKTGFLENVSSNSCFCGRTLKNVHKSRLKKLIRRNYMLTFKLDSFQLSSFGVNGFLLGYDETLNTHFTFQVHYKKVYDDIYEITGLTGIADSFFFVKTSDGRCLNSQQSFYLPNFTDLGLAHSIEFIESQIAQPKMPTFDQQLKQIKILLLINSILFIALILYSVNDQGMNKGYGTIWEALRGDIYRVPRNAIQICCLTGSGFQVLFTIFFASLFTYYSFVELIERIINILPWCGIFCGFVSIRILKFIGRYHWLSVYRATLTALPSFYVLIFSAKVFLHYFNSSVILPTNRTFLHVIYLLIVNCAMVSLGFYIGIKIYSNGPPVGVGSTPRKLHRPPFYMKGNLMKMCGGLFVYANIWKTIDFIYLSVINVSPYESSLSSSFYFLLLFIVVSAEVAIFYVYLQARHENFKWWWTSFIVPAFAFAYHLIYCFIKLRKYKILNIITICFSVLNHIAIAGALGVACGAVGFTSAFLYLLYIYHQPMPDLL